MASSMIWHAKSYSPKVYQEAETLTYSKGQKTLYISPLLAKSNQYSNNFNMYNLLKN